MASVATHFSAFLLLFPIGIRRLLSSSSLYLHNPSHFRSKLWYFSEPTWKNLDLYALLISLPIASFSQLFLFLSFSPGPHPTYRFSFFHQSSLVFAFWLLIIMIALHEHFTATSFVISESLVFVFGGVLFLLEYSVTEKGVSGLAGVVYGFSGGLTLVCAGACIYLSVKPSAFFAEFLLSSGLVFKATWLLQAGVSLYTDAFGMKGCGTIGSALLLPNKQEEDAVDVHCDLEEDKMRGFALVHLLFTVHAIVVMALAVALFGASNRNLRCGEAKGPLLSEIESASARMRPISEMDMD